MADTPFPAERLWYRWRTPYEKLGPLAVAMQERGMRRVLDLGCGAGRHLVYLARQGFDWTVFDGLWPGRGACCSRVGGSSPQ
jgi:tRNA G46 methylase TrmB